MTEETGGWLDLLSERWTKTHWHLLWVLAAPVLYYLGLLLYRLLYRDDQPTWIEQQLGLHLGDGAEGTPGWLGVTGYRSSPSAVKRALEGALAAPEPADPFALPKRIFQLMHRYDAPWCIAGGWALDLHLGVVTREHHDIEVAVLRRDQALLRDYLVGWHPQVVVPGEPGTTYERRPWEGEQELELPIHELHTRPPQADVHGLEILLNEADGEDWVYRRDARVRLPLARAIRLTPGGIPYLAPELVLLYKAKHLEERDRQDFATALARLQREQREWLVAALSLTAPGHPWLGVLRGPAAG